MNIALIAHNSKKDLMVQFCTAYISVLAKHTLCATGITGRKVKEETGLPIHLFMSGSLGGEEQIGARIAYNEIDLVLCFSDPTDQRSVDVASYLSQLCDRNNIPFASNQATAEMLVLGLARGDLDWRDIVNPKTKPFTA